MIIPSTRLFKAGEIETGSYLNSSITNLGNFVLGKPICSMRQTVAQSLAVSGTDYALTFNVEEVDRDNGHSTTTNTNRYTAQTAGYYYFDAKASFTGNATGTRSARFRKNGTNIQDSGMITPYALNTNACVLPLYTFVYLAVGDYVEIILNQSSGGALNTSVASPYQSNMTVIWVSV